jgi:hypothetical protein
MSQSDRDAFVAGAKWAYFYGNPWPSEDGILEAEALRRYPDETPSLIGTQQPMEDSEGVPFTPSPVAP